MTYIVIIYLRITNMENDLISKETRIIKKSNRLIQNVVNHCSYYQNRLLFVLLDKYGKKISNSKCDEITITVKELCDMLGYDYQAGNVKIILPGDFVNFMETE